MDFLVYFLVIFTIFMGAWLISYFLGKRKLGVFQEYAKQHFPELSEKDSILMAKQVSKTNRLDIAVGFNEKKKEIVVFQDKKGTGITHTVYPFKNLKEVNAAEQVISRGALPKTYSYERDMSLTFGDGNTYHLILENISNKRGDDKGAEIVKDMFAPWEEKFNNLLKK